MLHIQLQNDQNPIPLPLSLLSYFGTFTNMISALSPLPLSSEEGNPLVIALGSGDGHHMRNVIEWIIDAVALYHISGKEGVQKIEDLRNNLNTKAYLNLFPSGTEPHYLDSIKELTIGAKLFIIESLNWLDIPVIMSLVSNSLYRDIFIQSKLEISALKEDLRKWREGMGLSQMEEIEEEEECHHYTKVYQRQLSVTSFYSVAFIKDLIPEPIPILKYRQRMICNSSYMFIMSNDVILFANDPTLETISKMQLMSGLSSLPVMFIKSVDINFCLSHDGSLYYSNFLLNPIWKRLYLYGRGKATDKPPEVFSITLSGPFKDFQPYKLAMMTSDGIFTMDTTAPFDNEGNEKQGYIPMDGAQPIHIQYDASNSLIILTRNRGIWIIPSQNNDGFIHYCNYTLRYNQELPLENNTKYIVVDREQGLLIYENGYQVKNQDWILYFSGNDVNIEVYIDHRRMNHTVFSHYKHMSYSLLWTNYGLFLCGGLHGGVITNEKDIDMNNYREIGGYEGDILSIISKPGSIILYTTEGVYMMGEYGFPNKFFSEFQQIYSRDLDLVYTCPDRNTNVRTPTSLSQLHWRG